MKRAVFFSLLFTFSACTHVIEMESWPVNNVLVLNSFITPDSLVSCNVSKLRAIADTNDYYINTADVKVFNNENNQLLTTLKNVGQGNYCSLDYMPKVNVQYRIEVEAKGYSTLRAITSIPFKVVPDSAYALLDQGQEAIGQVSFVFDELCFSIEDKHSKANYFEVACGSYYWIKKDYNIKDWGAQSFEMEDSLLLFSDLVQLSVFTNHDMVIVNEDLLLYEPEFIIFSDLLFSNSMHQFKVRCSVTRGKQNYFSLISLSPELYEYRKTLIQHKFEQGKKGIDNYGDLTQLDFSNKVIDVYSNCDGGYGIFAGYNISTKYSDYFQYSTQQFDEYGSFIGELKNKIIHFNLNERP